MSKLGPINKIIFDEPPVATATLKVDMKIFPQSIINDIMLGVMRPVTIELSRAHIGETFVDADWDGATVTFTVQAYEFKMESTA